MPDSFRDGKFGGRFRGFSPAEVAKSKLCKEVGNYHTGGKWVDVVRLAKPKA